MKTASGRRFSIMPAMLKSNLLYSTVIENDGRIGKQFTVLGSLLLGSAALLGIAVLVAAVLYL